MITESELITELITGPVRVPEEKSRKIQSPDGVQMVSVGWVTVEFIVEKSFGVGALVGELDHSQTTAFDGNELAWLVLGVLAVSGCSIQQVNKSVTPTQLRHC